MRGIVLVGASTGAPRTHHIYLHHIPLRFAAPIVIIQHMPRGPFIEGMVKYLHDTVRVPCRLAQDGMRLDAGSAYLVEPGQHLRFDPTGRGCRLAPAEGENFFAPSMNVTFESAAHVFGARSFVIITSGLHADQDGIEGCRAVRRAGGRVVVTNRETTPCYHMVAQIRSVGEYDAEAPLERTLAVVNEWIGS
jgi:two-component system, chemotaxis family, protein-glutamate methylesterase/glutaminase